MTAEVIGEEPIKVQVTRWRCPFCGRGHSGRTRAVEHIGRCWFNPGARSCKTCLNFREGWGNGDTCAKGIDLNVPMEHRPNVFKLPINCSEWQPVPDEVSS
jgi:hypothetical protein